ncbi:HlyD family secretion protein [Mucilaginibacter paludis]|uniref:Secretion protein HlyD family protein n=1 Tax=Mucilaginibacter paludis DSM 18603 TaxID=714943 RepID=H1Y5X1_9SPHI|nr:HlyD family secretion protein [Mucilaginibacter paludis]EHQ30393.1 secretion protein HlyD family protein [Mucilaginibacter paludis DSM 18603]
METEEITAPAAQKNTSPLKFILIGVVAIAIAYFGGKKVYHAFNYETTDNAQVESNAIPVLSRASGYIKDFALKDYQMVKKGELLLTIDDSEYKIAVQQTAADLEAAKADLASAEAQINNISSDKGVADAGVSVEEVALAKAKRDLNRDQALFNDGSITQHQLDNSQSAYQSAIKQVVSSKSRVTQVSTQTGTANAQIQRAKANVAVREAQLENAKLNLSYTQILAPSTGKIGKTNLQQGQFVQAGQQLFSVINNEHFWIVANFKETQIEHMRVGQAVKIEVDGYPDKEITGKIAEFSDATGAKFSLLPPDNSSGNFVKVTQRVPVKIELDDPAGLREFLKAGLSVTVDVKVK